MNGSEGQKTEQDFSIKENEGPCNLNGVKGV